MADTSRRRRRQVGTAQLLLVLAALALWAASRLTWVTIRSFDGLGQPRQVALSGAMWSSALLPLAVVNLVAAVAALAVRGWRLRMLAVLLAAASFAIAYLGVSLWALPDVAARGADLAQVPLVTLVGSGRQYAGATIAVVAGLCALTAAALLMRAATDPATRPDRTRFLAPVKRGLMAGNDGADGGPPAAPGNKLVQPSERMLWDTLDQGIDPTDEQPRGDTQGR
ncbi:TIGR02234 family membrane protein [Mycobacterium sp.]|uniref:TIGR02234 family membrane protein n=1 Tax=Mycobacterium sp. TaxID=1785 RepID=UPI003A877FC4